MKLKKILFVILGCVGLALGAVGAVFPLLPAFPFLLLGELCKRTGYDLENENPHHDYRHVADEFWIYYYDAETVVYSVCDSCGCVGVPYCLFYIWCEDD